MTPIAAVSPSPQAPAPELFASDADSPEEVWMAGLTKRRYLQRARAIFNVSSKRLVFSSVNPSCLRWLRAESMRLLLRSLSRSNTRLRIRGEPDDFSASSHTK